MKIENSEGENGSNSDPMANDNNSGDRAICSETELKNLAQLVHDKWRKMVPKLGLTSEDEKLYEETNADEAGTYIIFNISVKILDQKDNTVICIYVMFKSQLLSFSRTSIFNVICLGKARR